MVSFWLFDLDPTGWATVVEATANAVAVRTDRVSRTGPVDTNGHDMTLEDGGYHA